MMSFFVQHIVVVDLNIDTQICRVFSHMLVIALEKGKRNGCDQFLFLELRQSSTLILLYLFAKECCYNKK